MAVTRNLFRIIAQQGYSPKEIANRINNALAVENEQGMFVTMFIGRADLKTGRLEFCNCGHNPPVICVPGEPARFLPIKHVNMALGMIDEIKFHGESVDDVRGWRILIYTDGLTEAENPSYELFGTEHLIEFMNENADQPSRVVIERIQETVELHRSGAIPSDDITLLCLKLL